MNIEYFYFKLWANYIRRRNIYLKNYSFVKVKKPDFKINFHKLSYSEINNLSINECILQLPVNLRVKIGVFCIKNYWKNDTLNRSYIPIWYNHRIYIEKQMYKCLLNNVHFLHLEYSCLS